MAVFGLVGTRQNAYKKMTSQAGMLHDLGIKEILDIGPEFDAPRELNGIPVRRAGALAAPDLADLLSHSISVLRRTIRPLWQSPRFAQPTARMERFPCLHRHFREK